MLSVALTGNIASGKSTVGAMFLAWGATVIDADQIVHQLQEPGTDVFRAIVARFGAGVVAADGTLDRAALRARVFGDPPELAALNAIVHPAVARERARRLELARAANAPIVVSDIPLLFEVGHQGGFDAVVLVDAPRTVRLHRLMTSRNLTEAAATAMIDAQMPSDAKRAKSTFIIDNDGDRIVLEARTRAVWTALEALARSRRAH
jgi:dephospho-CoA kinase